MNDGCLLYIVDRMMMMTVRSIIAMVPGLSVFLSAFLAFFFSVLFTFIYPQLLHTVFYLAFAWFIRESFASPISLQKYTVQCMCMYM